MANFDHDTVVPYLDSDASKKVQVAKMFDNIAHRYDFLNRFLSAGIDISWRKKALNELKGRKIDHLLDVATGTGDVAIMAAKRLKPGHITGIDISEGMLSFGREKLEKLGLSKTIDLLKGDSETISFENDTFDAVTVAFGVRNFQHLEKGLSEIFRVLKPGGKLVVLEFSSPSQPVFKGIYNLYMKTIAPGAGRLFSKDRKAYQYLDESIRKFPQGEAFLQVMKDQGFSQTTSKTLSLGICSIYCGVK